MDTQDIEFWRTKAHDYEWLYKEQKDICDGYRRLYDEQSSEMKTLQIQIYELNQHISRLDAAR